MKTRPRTCSSMLSSPRGIERRPQPKERASLPQAKRHCRNTHTLVFRDVVLYCYVRGLEGITKALDPLGKAAEECRRVS